MISSTVVEDYKKITQYYLISDVSFLTKKPKHTSATIETEEMSRKIIGTLK